VDLHFHGDPLNLKNLVKPMFTEKEITYIQSQPLARLATVSTSHQPDVAPVGFKFDGEKFLISGFDITRTFKKERESRKCHGLAGDR
jgi:hypothetical protein